MRRLILIATTAALTGCTMIPKYTRPEPPVPATFNGTGVAPAGTAPAQPTPVPVAAKPASEITWQEFFGDGKLRSVIGLALANNRDLRAASLNVEKVQAYYRIQRSDLYPTIGVQVAGEKYRVPEKMHSDGKATYTEDYSVNLGTLSWELDFFGRIRSLSQAALEQYLATAEARRAAQSALVAGVAQSYLALAADQESLNLAKATLADYQASLELIAKTRDLGLTSDLDVAQAKSQVEAARAAVAALTGRVAVDSSSLDLLAGAPVPADLLPGRMNLVTALAPLEPGLPSEVLLSRPDILGAEHRLLSANANIGAARAAFFPRITLTAGIGTMSPDLSGLFDSGTRTWSFTPQLLTPIFASGSLKANLKATQLDRDIAVAGYEKAIQEAFAEVSNALVLRGTLVEQRKAEEALVASLEDTRRLAEARYTMGLDSYLVVLVANRSLYAGQQALINVRLAEQANLVTLYKALGGGV
ncbi:MAG: efflux transporter outer membrane subunit [Thermoanaerobaculaceae bacterium]|nr:efflux transporter outer membrane subunit [Thermoanaerobaculaceae bacterium]MDI9621588.1 efflux transporter outer membrane subunit [Acidobacteriota bacterium]